MKFEYKGSNSTFPATLGDITLSQRIDFYTEHGKLLDEMAGKVEKITDENEKEIESSLWHLEMAARSFSFYTGIPLDEVKAQVNFEQLLNIYNVDMQLLFEQEKNIELLPSYDWDGEKWVIAAPELSPGSEMVFNEFLHAKEIVRQMDAVGKGKWDSLPYLCAIYLRKEGESFSEDLVAAKSERLKQMHELPLDIALSVAFFLSSTLSIYMTTLAFSEKGEPKE